MGRDDRFTNIIPSVITILQREYCALGNTSLISARDQLLRRGRIQDAYCIACVFMSMNEKFRVTFYKPYSLYRHVRENFWSENHYTSLRNGGVVTTGHDRETIQAVRGMSFARTYWPMDLVEPFVRRNWYVPSIDIAI